MYFEKLLTHVCRIGREAEVPEPVEGTTTLIEMRDRCLSLPKAMDRMSPKMIVLSEIQKITEF